MSHFNWLNEASELFLKRGYLRDGLDGEGRVREMADEFGRRAGKEYGDKFYDYMGKGFYSLSSPVWGNYGPQSKAYSVSCFGTYFNDSIPSILQGASEIGSMSQKGGGCSGYMSNIRPRGSKVNNGRGSTSGVVHFLELFETLTSVISQSGVRRGFFTPYLDAEHGDAKEFIRIGSEGHPIQSLTSGLNLSDQFMNRVISKDMDALGIWAEFVKNRKEVGYPYGHFTGNANKYTVDVYKDKGMEIVASNMCVAPYTKLLTSEGEKTISELEGKTVSVWNSSEWSDVVVHKTSPSEDIYRVTVEDLEGNVKHLDCTAYHRWYVESGEEVRTSDLKKGDALLVWSTPESLGGLEQKFVVRDVVDLKEKMPVYCFTEHKRGMAVFNGILTGQCQEIELPSSPDESFVCVLSSMNALKWDEWKDTDAVRVLTRFLDTVVDDFIEKLEAERDRDEDGAMTFDNMKRAYRFAKRHRALGIGSLGLHDLFMSKMIAFDSDEADVLDVAIHKRIQEEAWAESRAMAEELGEPEVLEGYGRRNTTLTAIAPTKSSSFLLGQVSQGVEPRMSNYYIEDLAKTKDLQKNKYLKDLLASKDMDTREIWKSIAAHDGSVQHLVDKGLTQEESDVFATFGEISPYSIVDKAAARQKYVDQGQSINLMIGSGFSPREISQLYIHAWKVGLKGLYYSYNTSSAQELTRKAACASCSL